MDITPALDIDSVDNAPPPARDLKDFLAGTKTNILPAHGWTSASILFNHLDENVKKVMDKPMSSLAAVIIGRDRPADRATAADAIADAIVSMGLATHDDFTVIPATPKDGDPDTPILPHTTLIMCNSSQLKDKITGDATKAIIHTRRKDESDGFTFYLMPVFPDHSWYIGTFVGLSDRLTTREFLAAFFEKLIADRDAIKLIEDPIVSLTPTTSPPLSVSCWHTPRLSLAKFGCLVAVPRQANAKTLCVSTCRHPLSRTTLLKPGKRSSPRPHSPLSSTVADAPPPSSPRLHERVKLVPWSASTVLGLTTTEMSAPLLHPEFLAVHLNQAERDSVNVGTTLATIRDKDKMDPMASRPSIGTPALAMAPALTSAPGAHTRVAL
ncbi:hypothetical protein C8J57DRAFT_1338065, partial [Mycena rebaudengoi]